MFAVISPAKKLADQLDYTGPTTEIRFPKETSQLIHQLKTLSANQLGDLMHISDTLAQLNFERYQAFKPHQYTDKNAMPAVYLFQGDVYRYLEVNTLTDKQRLRLQDRLGILSGLYGLLKPLDLIQPYRLEMGTSLCNVYGNNLYDVWRSRVTPAINASLAQCNTRYLVNLASQEYFSAIDTQKLDGTVIQVDFKDRKDGKLRTLGVNAKRARGAMARYLAKKSCKTPSSLCDFNGLDYTYSEEHSSQHHLVFVR
ncbi:MAG: peroxide stress protein YaaA [Coxiellaceae bacterium]|nr:peroxide stress protein YaaA [Coxiellaceae bacterium]|tara:strand:- start:3310 stop:4074 length:765 start_codon:yes stop_codon:yes gene_type:complete